MFVWTVAVGGQHASWSIKQIFFFFIQKTEIKYEMTGQSLCRVCLEIQALMQFVCKSNRMCIWIWTCLFDPGLKQ